MKKPLSELSVNGKIHFVLIKTATTLTGRDFLKITEITNQAHGEIHIIHGSWQVLIGFPETQRQFVEKALKKIGYVFKSYSKGLKDLQTFTLNTKAA